MSGPQARAFEIPIEVRSEDIDVLGHVNNVVYLRWVQDVAVAHWNALTSDEEKAEAAWVVVRHEIDYRQPARSGDRLVARTWVGVRSGRTYERHTEILRAEQGPVLARARTLWVPLDPATGRPRRLGEALAARFSAPSNG